MADLAPHIAFFRGRWATRFIDSCRIRRETGGSLNQTTGQWEPTFDDLYTGGAVIRPKVPEDVQYGQELITAFDHVVFIPWDQSNFEPGDIVDQITTADGQLTGKTLTVTGIPGDSYVTRRVLLCEEKQ